MQNEDIIKDIRKRCRMAMNGIASTSMRKHGLDYKLNFGVDLLKIKELSKKYSPDTQLAELLWEDQTRELKILSTILHPKESFDRSKANIWVTQISNQEIREQLCANLLQEIPYANTVALEWANSDNIEIRTTGYWLLARRLIIKKVTEKLDLSDFNFVWDDISLQQVSLRNAALLFIKNIGKQSENTAKDILKGIEIFRISENPLSKEIYESLLFEFEFFYDKEFVS